MKSIKYIVMSLAVAAGTAFTSCTDLDETIYSQLTDEVVDVTDDAVIESMMGEAYTQLRYLYWGWNGYFDLQEECSDTYMTPSRIGVGWGAFYILMHKHTWNAEQEHLEGFWYYAYVGIGYANQCIDVLPETGYAQAQMRFVRALNYYMLLDAFRNVPLETTRDVPEGHLPEQKSAQEIYDFCVSELNAIKDDLGTDKVFGYANRYAADMALAKLYLNHNAWFGGDDTSYYQKALEEVNDVINNGGYQLEANYADNFKTDISKSTECIFALPLDGTNASHCYLVNKCLVGAGAAAYGFQGSPWNGSCAVPQFIESYDPDDTRLTDTWTGGVQRYYTADGGPQSGDPIPFSDDDWAGQGVLNYSLQVHSIDNPGAYQQEGYRFVKEECQPDNHGTYGDDVNFFRLADAMFIKAECLLRLGQNEDEAASLVTQVRQRAFGSNVAKATRTAAQLKGGSVYDYGHREYTCEGYANWDPASFKSTSEGGADIILGGLLDDLGWEFVGEHHRRQDLIRFKMKDGRNVFNGKSWFCKDATNETHWDYFPIPKSALDANISMKQNEGYN